MGKSETEVVGVLGNRRVVVGVLGNRRVVVACGVAGVAFL